jgi:cytochrome c-type biogenesis protein CcmH
MRLLPITLLLLLWLPVAHAVVENQDILPGDFTSPGQKQRFKELIKDLRCTVCQNQNLADSHASLAVDLRHQILEMMQKGKNDQEIMDFLVARYGDFVLYNPPFKSTTYILWTVPFIALFFALGLLVRLIKKRQQQQPPLAGTDKQALADALRSAGQSSLNVKPKK